MKKGDKVKVMASRADWHYDFDFRVGTQGTFVMLDPYGEKTAFIRFGEVETLLPVDCLEVIA